MAIYKDGRRQNILGAGELGPGETIDGIDVSAAVEEINQRLAGGIYRPPQTFDLLNRPFFSPPPVMPPSNNFFHSSDFFTGNQLHHV